MQNIKITIGLPHEGKTTEILESFLNHYNNKDLSEKVKPVFIAIEETYEILKELAKQKLNLDIDFKDSFYNLHDFKDNSIENILGSIILSNLEKNDCLFYLDGIHGIIENFHEKIVLLINSFPNNIIKHSFDVEYTMNALPSKYLGVNSIKK